MLGSMITQDDIDRSPWRVRVIFYTLAYTYLAGIAIVKIYDMLIQSIKRVKILILRR